VYFSAQSATKKHIIKRSLLFLDLHEDGKDSVYTAALNIRERGAV
jgi:hypothetical protein